MKLRSLILSAVLMLGCSAFAENYYTADPEDAVSRAKSGDNIFVEPGVYTLEKTLILERAVSLSSRAGRADSVIFKMSKSGALIEVNNNNAMVSAITIIGDQATGLLVDKGSASHCVISNCLIGAEIKSGKFSNSLVAACTDGVKVSGSAQVENCSVIANAGKGIELIGDESIVRNTVMFGNGTDKTGLSQLFQCCLSTAELTETDFKNYAKGDFRPTASGKLANAGDPAPQNSFNYPKTDLTGNKRVVGGIIDIGAYESFGGLSVRLR